MHIICHHSTKKCIHFCAKGQKRNIINQEIMTSNNIIFQLAHRKVSRTGSRMSGSSNLWLYWKLKWGWCMYQKQKKQQQKNKQNRAFNSLQYGILLFCIGFLVEKFTVLIIVIIMKNCSALMQLSAATGTVEWYILTPSSHPPTNPLIPPFPQKTTTTTSHLQSMFMVNHHKTAVITSNICISTGKLHPNMWSSHMISGTYAGHRAKRSNSHVDNTKQYRMIFIYFLNKRAFRLNLNQKADVVSQLVDILSPVNHKGLHQG